ncbi:MAG TPA: twin transmembrane helix small protein [Thiothrix sp.]|nr:twin transmembrane helix small protein [Thiothrix sp.]
MKYVIITFFIFILYSLGSALFYMMKDAQDSKRMVKALTVRIVLSLIMFLVLMFSFWMGWIKPTGVS